MSESPSEPTSRASGLPAHLAFPADRGSHRLEIAVQQTQTRRAFGLLGLTLIAPGSAQMLAGSRNLGRLVLRIVGLLAMLAVALGMLMIVNKNLLIGWGLTGWIMQVLGWFVTVLGIGWGLLFVDAWRIGHPGRIRPRARIPHALVALALALLMTVAGIAGGHCLRAIGSATSRVLPGGGEKEAKEGRYNILLLGGDAGEDREGMRPDSISVVSVDTKTGRAVIIGVPRNVQQVRWPTSSPMHDIYPNGWDCDDCMINAINTEVESNYRQLYPTNPHPGLEATKEAVEELTGLDINFYVLIDLAGFQKLIDALGGVNINLSKGVPIWWDASGRTVTYQIGPGQNIHLDGQNALWLVRARKAGTDFERMQRQKCVMNAMLHQMNPQTVLTKFTELASASADTISTDVPADIAGTLMDVALKTRKLPISSVSLVPPLFYPGSPKYDLARGVVKEAIEASKRLDSPNPKAKNKVPVTTGPTSPVPATTVPLKPTSAPPTPEAETVDPEAQPTTENLEAVCQAA